MVWGYFDIKNIRKPITTLLTDFSVELSRYLLFNIKYGILGVEECWAINGGNLWSQG